MSVCTSFNFLIWLPVAAAATVAVGHLIMWPFHEHIERKAGLSRMEVYGRVVCGVPSWLTGANERAVFAPAFVIAPAEGATGALVWLGLKMAANLERDLPEPLGVEKGDALKLRRRAFLALISGFLSLAIAAFVGLSIRARLLWPLNIEH